MSYIIYGTGKFSEVLFDEININNENVSAFTLEDNLINSENHLDKPLLPFSEVEKMYNPLEFELIIAILYQEKNQLREKYFLEGLKKGYPMNGFVSNQAKVSKTAIIGKNNIVLGGNLIQTGVQIGNNNIFWNSNHIGHHSEIQNNCFFSSHVVLSGNCKVGSNSFFGVNSTVIDNLLIEDFSLIGAGATVKTNTKKNEVVK